MQLVPLKKCTTKVKLCFSPNLQNLQIWPRDFSNGAALPIYGARICSLPEARGALRELRRQLAQTSKGAS